MSGRTRIDDDRHEGGLYELHVDGHLDGRWAAWFDGLRLTHQIDGTTVIHGLVADQAALHGLLQRVRDIGLPLVSVIRVEPDHPGPGSTEPRPTPTNTQDGD